MPGSGRYSSVSWSMILQCETTVRYCITAQILETERYGPRVPHFEALSPLRITEVRLGTIIPSLVPRHIDLGYRVLGKLALHRLTMEALLSPLISSATRPNLRRA